MKNLVILLSLFLLCSCMSGYQQFYTPNNTTLRGFDLEYLSNDEEPQLYGTSNIDEEMYDVLADHYEIIGSSNFEGPSNDVNLAKKQAKKVGAKIVLLQQSYARTVNSIYGNNQSINSYYVDRYNYSVLYFAKIKNKMSVGIIFGDLTEKERTMYNINTGCIILLVYKNTPAFYANLVRGDIILKVDDKDILNTEDLQLTLEEKEYDNEINITYLRRGSIYTTKIIKQQP